MVGNSSNPTLAYSGPWHPKSHCPTPSAQTLPPQHQFRLALRSTLRPFTDHDQPRLTAYYAAAHRTHSPRTRIFLIQLKHSTPNTPATTTRHLNTALTSSYPCCCSNRSRTHHQKRACIPPQHVVVDQPVSTAQPPPPPPRKLDCDSSTSTALDKLAVVLSTCSTVSLSFLNVQSPTRITKKLRRPQPLVYGESLLCSRIQSGECVWMMGDVDPCAVVLPAFPSLAACHSPVAPRLVRAAHKDVCSSGRRRVAGWLLAESRRTAVHRGLSFARGLDFSVLTEGPPGGASVHRRGGPRGAGSTPGSKDHAAAFFGLQCVSVG